MKRMLAITLVPPLAALAFLGQRTGIDVLLGMLGPLVAVGTSWALIQRTYRRAPEQVTLLMVAAFGAKIVFFGAYVVVVLHVPGVRPAAFVSSFTAYFVALYAIEALYMHRLFVEGGSRLDGRHA